MELNTFVIEFFSYDYCIYFLIVVTQIRTIKTMKILKR